MLLCWLCVAGGSVANAEEAKKYDMENIVQANIEEVDEDSGIFAVVPEEAMVESEQVIAEDRGENDIELRHL